MKIAVLADKADAERVGRLVQGAAQVLWTAPSLSEATRLLRAMRPDVLLAAAGKLRGASGLGGLGVPVVVLRSRDASDASLTYQAMNAGAVYALLLPPDDATSEQRQAALRSLRLSSSAALGASAAPASGAHAPPAHPPQREPAGGVLAAGAVPRVVALGASTGGPPALAEVLRALHPTSAAVVIVQHLDPPFIPDLARWLAQQSGMPVDLSTSTTTLRSGRALLAASDHHLVASPGGALRHEPAAATDIHHPSVDALFLSLAAHAPAGAAALLTGMGRDGADGLLAMRRAGWITLAQDAATSSVYGMPKAAHESGAASATLPLSRLGPRLRQAIGDTP